MLGGRKRGISHVEVVMSFMIFIVAVGFALYFFNPGDSDRLVESSLTYAFREIYKNASVGVETFSVKINASEIPAGTDVIALNIPGVKGNAVVENYDGEIFESMKQGDLVFVKSEVGWASEEFIFVRFSEDFVNGVVSPAVLNEGYYELGSSNFKEVVSEKKFLLLNETYYSDYLALKGKGNFNLPERVNFGFSLVFDEADSINSEVEIPSGFEVFSDTERIEVVRADGKIAFADLLVKVW
jgi:hypothetical protein